MSSEHDHDATRGFTARVRRAPRAAIADTRQALARVRARRDARAAVGLSLLGYLLVYEVALGHVAVGPWDLALSVVGNPLARSLQPVGPAQYEPVAFVALGPARFLVVPVNLVIGAGLGALVGANLAVSLVAWRERRCRTGAGASALAGLPALFSGVACCGPALLLVVGVQATAGLLALFQWLVPVAVALLLGTLAWNARQVPDAVTPRSGRGPRN